MKILVTGSTGFIGSYVIDELLKYDHEIIATSRSRSKAIQTSWWNKVKYVECDLYSEIDFYSLFDTPELVIHLAWDGLPNYSSLFHFEKNLPASYSFLKNMIISGVKNIAVLGTCFEYGLKNGCLTEEEIAQPVTAYGLAKDTLRKYLQLLSAQYQFSFKWIRLFYVYGKNQNEKSLIPKIDAAIENNQEVFNMSGGEQLRDYLPVEKVAEYIVKIALQTETMGIINCCSNQPISIRKFVEDYLHQRNSEMKINYGYYPYAEHEPMAFWGDDTKLKTILKEVK